MKASQFAPQCPQSSKTPRSSEDRLRTAVQSSAALLAALRAPRASATATA